MSNYIASPRSLPRGGLLVLHAWWGLNEFQRSLCDRLASQGYVALAPDLYGGRVAGTIPQATKLRRALNQETASRQILGALQQLQSESPSHRLAVLGFSMGANWALWLVDEKPRTLSAAVLFYGTRAGDCSRSMAAFLGHFAEHDPYVSASGRAKLEKSLRLAGKDVVFFEYPRTHHWFFEGDRPEFDAAAADLAWRRTIRMLEKYLG